MDACLEEEISSAVQSPRFTIRKINWSESFPAFNRMQIDAWEMKCTPHKTDDCLPFVTESESSQTLEIAIAGWVA